jgi:hypothetical protein
VTQTPDPEEPGDRPTGREPGAGRRLDENAVWEDIVANYGDRAEVDPEPPAPPEPRPTEAERDERLRGLFQPTWNDPLDDRATWDDEGHFVPPEPPPPPRAEPRRRAAWFGLFGAPTVMLVAVVLGWSLPAFVSAVLAAAFVAGFVYLVATMPNRRSGPGDGAVV